MKHSMLGAAQGRFFLKRFGLFCASLLFLSSIECAVYATAPDSSVSLHAQSFSFGGSTADDFCGEGYAEDDLETRSQLYILTGGVYMPQAHVENASLQLRIVGLVSSLVSTPQNSRAPPAL